MTTRPPKSITPTQGTHMGRAQAVRARSAAPRYNRIAERTRARPSQCTRSAFPRDRQSPYRRPRLFHARRTHDLKQLARSAGRAALPSPGPLRSRVDQAAAMAGATGNRYLPGGLLYRLADTPHHDGRMEGDPSTAMSETAGRDYLYGDGLIWRHATEPASLIPPSYWARLVRRHGTILCTAQGALELWDHTCIRNWGRITCPSADKAGIVIDFILRFEPRRLPRPRSLASIWPCGARCSRWIACRPRTPGKPLFARRWRTCGRHCGQGWNPNRGPHRLCRCSQCEMQERRAIARRIAERMERQWAGQEQPPLRLDGSALVHRTAAFLGLRLPGCL